MSFKGKTNIYVCPTCRGNTITVDVADGVTPFLIDCKVTAGCAGLARSCMYEPRMFPLEYDPPKAVPVPAWEWYKPGGAVVQAMPVALQAHVEAGGLFLRKRGGPLCTTVECGGDAKSRIFWPGQEARGMCEFCTGRAKAVSEAMGFHLVVEPL